MELLHAPRFLTAPLITLLSRLVSLAIFTPRCFLNPWCFEAGILLSLDAGST